MPAAQGRTGIEETARSITHASVGNVEIRRTTDGIPHLRAASWRDLGIGVGFVQAEDTLCTLAEAFVTFSGRRSYYFGPDARPDRDSTFGRPKNLDLDFLFRAFADAEVVAQYRVKQPQELNALIEGFAVGYNHYVTQARKAKKPATRQACLQAAWVREISAEDIYRRMFAANIVAGYSRFIPEIVNAHPPVSGAADHVATSSAELNELRARLAQRVGNQQGVGSNVLAFGAKATGGNGEDAHRSGHESVLFGNPHWYWGGPDRFYQMHLTIPGRLNVAGVSFLGIPLVMIGFNEHVAWSHTVSEARRFGLFDLALDPADPTRYIVDGVSEPMQARTVNVEVLSESGQPHAVSRTMYRTRFGPLIDLGAHNAAFGWGKAHAVSLRDINVDNFRIFRNFFYWNQAKSLEDFIAIQHREVAVPWINTVAIGKTNGRVWYGDVGAVPNVSDTQREACSTPLAKGFADVDPLTPFLDGSRSVCNWQGDIAAVQTGAMPSLVMPGLLREDYVANMNDSYWLSNPAQPLEGYPALLGGERQALSLRGRFGHHLAQSLIDAKLTSSKALSRRLMREVLNPRAYSAELFKSRLLDAACKQGDVKFINQSLDKKDVIRPTGVSIIDACRILRHWSNTANAGDRGALLWDGFWTRLEKIPEAEFYKLPFSREMPLQTPSDPNAADPRVAQALAATVQDFRSKGWSLDARTGSQRFVRSNGQRIPLFGGCADMGYFTVACNENGSYVMGPNSWANSYLQVVRFGPQGVEAHTLLAHGLQETGVNNGADNGSVKRYARKEWLRFPFREQDIVHDPALKRLKLRP